MSVTVNWKEFSDSLFFFQQNMLYAITIIFFPSFWRKEVHRERKWPVYAAQNALECRTKQLGKMFLRLALPT